MSLLTIDAVNALSDAEFMRQFGDVAEHSLRVAEAALRSRPFADRAAFVAAFVAAVAAAPAADQLRLINAHPDLAGKAALAGKLTDDSAREQAGAGLDSLSAEEFARFTRLNDGYKARFGFPFIFAVKGATKEMILAAFETRIGHDAITEFATALEQVGRIFRFRIEAKVEPPAPARSV